jgi:hypothetical protein
MSNSAVEMVDNTQSASNIGIIGRDCSGSETNCGRKVSRQFDSYILQKKLNTMDGIERIGS